jgi:hypothetical protein
MANVAISQPPVFNTLTGESGLIAVDWQTWMNQMYDASNNFKLIPNNHIVLNPDFNWSRTVGNTPTVGNGEFVEEWDVDVGGMTSTVTPTYYTSIKDNALTGSERYVNFDVTAVTANEYEISQDLANQVSKFHEKPITFSALIMNNGASKIKVKFHVGFDIDNSGTEDFIEESRPGYVEPNLGKPELITATFRCPTSTSDNQANTVYVKMIILDATAAFDFDLYFIKPEFSLFVTPIYVDQTIEKLKIDN